MTTIPFGPWRPDLPDFVGVPVEGAPYYSTIANNAIWESGVYKPMPGLTNWSTSLSGTCKGAVAFLDRDGNTRLYAGDANGLYYFVDTTPTDASKSGGYNIAADDYWEFAKWQNTVIATNVNDPLQTLSFGSVQFADLVTSSLKPQARHIGVVRDFVVLGNVSENGVLYPDRIRWNSIGDPLDYEQSANNQADSEDLEGAGGWIRAVIGGSYGLIFQERAISRMIYVGSPAIFAFDTFITGPGAWAPYGTCKFGETVYFISDDGFEALHNGVTLEHIGKDKVDGFFFTNVNEDRKHRITCGVDPRNHLIGWAVPSTASSGRPDRVYLYNIVEKEFTIVEVDVEFLFSSLSVGYTLEGLDAVSSSVGALPFSLDSRVWTGGNLLFSAFDTGHRLANFNGSDLAARLVSAEFQLFADQRASVTNMRPLVDGAVPVMRIGHRDQQQGSHSFSSSVTTQADGLAPQIVDARYHRLEANIPAGGFTNARGVDVEAVATGQF